MSTDPSKRIRYFPKIDVNLVILLAVVTSTLLTVYKHNYFSDYFSPLVSLGENKLEIYVPEFPYYPEKYFTLDNWEIRKVQPLFVGFTSEGNSHYLLLKIDDRVFKGLLPTQVSFVDLGKETQVINFEDLKKKLTKDTQIGLAFLSKYPPEQTRNLTYCYNFEYYCGVAALHDNLTESTLISYNYTVEGLQNLSGSNILPILEIYLELAK